MKIADELAGIIHGDIKPQNVLVFEGNSRIVAKVADFGFATCFQSHDDLIVMPKSEPWNAPEHHYRLHRPEQARQMDIYSFGMLCFWLIFGAGSSSSLQSLPPTYLERGQYFSFEQCQSKGNLLQDWKINGNKLLEWIKWLIKEDQRLNSRLKDNLLRFFESTLPTNPKLREQNLERPLELIVPNR